MQNVLPSLIIVKWPGQGIHATQSSCLGSVPVWSCLAKWSHCLDFCHALGPSTTVGADGTAHDTLMPGSFMLTERWVTAQQNGA